LSITSSTAWTSSVPEETTISVSVSAISAVSGLLASRRGNSAKIGEFCRVLSHGFQGHRAFGAQQLHQPGGQDDRVDVILLGVPRAFEDLAKGAAQRFQTRAASCR
jgi:hypothetical protein